MLGLGQPSGASQGSLKGFPSSTVFVIGGCSWRFLTVVKISDTLTVILQTIELTLKLLRMAALTKTELDVAVPHSFFAKHMYWPGWGKSFIDERWFQFFVLLPLYLYPAVTRGLRLEVYAVKNGNFCFARNQFFGWINVFLKHFDWGGHGFLRQ